MESFLKVYRNDTCLPVMAMNYVRLKSCQWYCRKRCLTEESEFFNILMNIAVWLISVKIKFVINKIEMNAFIFHFKKPHILASPCQIYIEISYIFHHIFIFLRNTSILRNHNSYIIFSFIKILRQASNYICKSTCFYKWCCFRSNK